MALEGPQLRFTRDESDETPPSSRRPNSEDTTDSLAKALRLARQVEELLEATPSSDVARIDPNRAHSTRMARAMAASLVDELEAIQPSGAKLKSGVA